MERCGSITRWRCPPVYRRNNNRSALLKFRRRELEPNSHEDELYGPAGVVFSPMLIHEKAIQDLVNGPVAAED